MYQLQLQGQMIFRRFICQVYRSHLSSSIEQSRCFASWRTYCCPLASEKQLQVMPACSSGRVDTVRQDTTSLIRCYSKGLLSDDKNVSEISLARTGTQNDEIALADEALPAHPKKPVHFIDKLHAQLRESDVDATLNIVSKFYRDMVTEHVSHSLLKIYNHLVGLTNSDRDLAITDLKADKRFQLLCVLAAKKGRFNTPYQVLKTINTLTLMKFGSDNKIMQVFLELAKHHVNSYNCKDIVHFGFLLTKCEETQQVFILKQQLTLALKLILYKEIQFLNSPQLCNLLTAFGESLNKNQMSLIMDALLVQKDSSKFKSYERVLQLLAKLKQRDTMLIKVCLKRVQNIVHLDRISDKNMMIVLKSLAGLQYYCGQTYTDLDHHIAGKDVTTAELSDFLNAFLACLYCPKYVMDKFIGGLEHNSEELDFLDVGELNLVLRPLALSNWKDGRLGPIVIKLKKIAEGLVDNFDPRTQGSVTDYVELLVNLLVLGCKIDDLPVREDLLEQCLDVMKISDVSTQLKVLHNLGLICLAHKAQIGKDLQCMNHLKATLDTVINRKNVLMQPVLSRILGGNAFVADKVFESGLLIGHVFALDKERGTLAASEILAESEDSKSSVLKPATSSQERFAIVIMRAKHVLRNVRRLTGPAQLQLDLLCQLRYHTVVVVPHVWEAVPEKERMDLLKLKLEVAKEDGTAYIS